MIKAMSRGERLPFMVADQSDEPGERLSFVVAQMDTLLCFYAL